jgi:rRNA maturation endonuclease Nob1
MTRTAWGWIAACRGCDREVAPDETYCANCSGAADELDDTE